MNLEDKAKLHHWLVASLAIIGIIVLFNFVTGREDMPVGTQAGVDITALLVLGG